MPYSSKERLRGYIKGVATRLTWAGDAETLCESCLIERGVSFMRGRSTAAPTFTSFPRDILSAFLRRSCRENGAYLSTSRRIEANLTKTVPGSLRPELACHRIAAARNAKAPARSSPGARDLVRLRPHSGTLRASPDFRSPSASRSNAMTARGLLAFRRFKLSPEYVPLRPSETTSCATFCPSSRAVPLCVPPGIGAVGSPP
jgi:hypothetical protein